MATRDIKRKPYIEDNDENIFIGIDLPFRNSDGVQGYFASTSTTIEAVKVNIKNPRILETDSKTRHNANVMALEKLGVNRNKAEDIVDKAFEEKGNLTTQISSRAQKKGYDSIIFKVDGKIQELLVYNKKDVKSIFEKKHGGSVIERNPYNYKPKAI